MRTVPVTGAFVRHGGRLDTARSLFPQAAQPWIDLSTGINPRAYPAPRSSTRARNRLPELAELARLETVAAQAFGVSDAARVVATGGTETALRLLPHVLQLQEAIIAGPTYGSHAHAWASAGARTHTLPCVQLEMHATRRTSITIVNPNNPDGRIVDRRRLLALHDSVCAHDGALIVDEAFVEVVPEISIADIAGTPCAPRLIALRSFGKFFGLAGLRLGFIVAEPRIAAAMRHLIGDWPVSSDALAAGLVAYADSQWMQHTRAALARAARRLDRVLVRSGFEIAGGTSLYRLARSPDAPRRFTQLLAAGILVRPFDHDETLLRFGLPRGRSEWNRLAAALWSDA